MSESEHRLSRRGFLLPAVARRAAVVERIARWQAIDTPLTGTPTVFWGVWAASPDHVFVVGDDGVALHFDGRAWSRQETGTKLPLHAVWGAGPDETFAVGWMGTICHRRDGVWRWIQGGVVESGTGRFANAVVNQPLFGLWGRARDNVWAVGDHGRIVHYDGETWTEQDAPGDRHLRAVTGLPDGSLLACGVEGTLIRFEGGRWQPVAIDTTANLTGIWARDEQDVYAVGGRYDSAANGFTGSVFHFDGRQWRELHADTRMPRLRHIDGDAKLAIVVGDGGSVYAVVDDRVSPLASGTQHDLFQVAWLGDGAMATGDFGTVLRSGGGVAADTAASFAVSDASKEESRWRRMTHEATDRVLWSVWGAGPRDVFAVGESGTALHFDGHRWVAMETPTDLHLHGVWGSSPRNVFAVGQLGIVLHYDGTVWREVHRLGVDVTAVAVTGFGPHDIVAVGDEGLIMTFDGAHWQRTASGTKNALYGVWGMDGQHVLAVGDFGNLLRWNGQRWDEFNAGTDHFLYGVWGDALDNVFVVGLSGGIFHFDGTRWSQQSTRLRADLLALAGRPGHGPIAVGTGGTAVAYDGTRWAEERTGVDTSLRALWMADDGSAIAVGDSGTILLYPSSRRA